MSLAKDERLLATLIRLREDLGGDAFVIEDHWGADLRAIGIARPSDRRYLVYVSVSPSGDGSLSFQCESPALEGSHLYDSAEMVVGARYEDLVQAVRAHLSA